jgi:hypothetical protein
LASRVARRGELASCALDDLLHPASLVGREVVQHYDLPGTQGRREHPLQVCFEDLPFVDERRVLILDTVQGIRDVLLIEGDSVDALILSPRGSVHDFDLAFQLRYLKKLNKLGEVSIIGIPQEGEVDYLRIQSILRKLVAHDMQGS